jgi:aminoglycoside phosphotransferase (APT) family kinase protein
MPVRKMHDHEVDIDAALVCRLLAAQLPRWADLPIEPVPSAGTDNALYRLGDDRVVRLPRVQWAAGQVDKEQRWLPKLAPLLPLTIPVPLAVGAPGEGYPWHWSVYEWLEGEDATLENVADPSEVARELARFVVDLQRIDPGGGPSPGRHNVFRGVPLAMRDEYTRSAITALQDVLDTDVATAAWEAALEQPAWDGPPVWIHGDLKPGNLLARRGRLDAVIDFGCLGVGDPACDLQVAWNFFSGEARSAFREALQVDGTTWARGRGWALSVALVALPYYETRNRVLADNARSTIAEVLAECRIAERSPSNRKPRTGVHR